MTYTGRSCDKETALSRQCSRLAPKPVAAGHHQESIRIGVSIEHAASLGCSSVQQRQRRACSRFLSPWTRSRGVPCACGLRAAYRTCMPRQVQNLPSLHPGVSLTAAAVVPLSTLLMRTRLQFPPCVAGFLWPTCRRLGPTPPRTGAMPKAEHAGRSTRATSAAVAAMRAMSARAAERVRLPLSAQAAGRVA